MAQQWELESATGRCSVTGREFEEGEEFYTVLFESGETFTRTDFSLDSWPGAPENAFCFFKTRVPVKEKRKQLLVNNEILVNFFKRLGEETEPVRIQFRFVLALILMRKRTLRYDGSKMDQGYEVWDMTLMSDKKTHRVINPNLTDEQIEGVSGQLSAILHSDMGEWANEPEETDLPSPSPPVPDDSTTHA